MSNRGVSISLLVAVIFLLSYVVSDYVANFEEEDAEKRGRIVAMAPSTCEVLYAIGLGDRVVGVSRFTTYPEEAAMKPKVGGYLDVDLEALLRLDPDVVVLLEEQQDLAKSLDRLGVKTVLVSHMSVEGIQKSHSVLAEYFGVEKNADAVLGEMRQRITAVSDRMQGGALTKVLIVIGRERGEGKVLSLIAAGAAGYHQELLRLANVSNGYEGREPFPKLTLEHLLKMNPDVIIDMVNTKDAASVGVEMIQKDWLSHPELKAVREGRVHVLVGDKHFVPGPRLVETLEWIAEKIEKGGR